MTERQIFNRRREATREALQLSVKAEQAGNRSLATHWLDEAQRLVTQPLTMDADLRLRTPYDSAIAREHDR